MDSTAHARPNYIAIWGWLAALTVVEVGVAFVSHLPKVWLVLILIFLAIWKAWLVALYFMHLKFERWRLRTVFMIPLPLAVLLVIIVLMERP
jgi:cytochrome c oxidase subunit 4